MSLPGPARPPPGGPLSHGVGKLTTQAGKSFVSIGIVRGGLPDHVAQGIAAGARLPAIGSGPGKFTHWQCRSVNHVPCALPIQNKRMALHMARKCTAALDTYPD
jgi:hypothetical protein